MLLVRISVTSWPPLRISSKGLLEIKGEDGDRQSPEDAAQIATLTKQVADMEQVANARDEQIKKVRNIYGGVYVRIRQQF